MIDPVEKHLALKAIVELAKSRHAASSSAGGHPHLNACSRCRRLLRLFLWRDASIAAASSSSYLRPACLPEDFLLGMAANLLSPRTTTLLNRHILNCDACAGVLRRIVALLADDRLPEEGKLCAAVEAPISASRAQWASRLARQRTPESPTYPVAAGR